MPPVAQERRDVVQEIAGRFASNPAVEGVCLFGSLARGEPDEWSDIDLLVVGRDEELRPTVLLRALPERLRRERLSLVCYSTNELWNLFVSGSSFVDHLRHEGRILHDPSGFLARVLRSPFEPRLSVEAELSAELERLAIYDDLSLFKRNFLFPLAQLYAIGKSVVILGLLAQGRRVYSRERAFGAFRTLHPELSDEIDAVERLRPFYRRITRRKPEPLPFPYRNAEEDVRLSIAAIRKIAAAVR